MKRTIGALLALVVVTASCGGQAGSGALMK